MEPDELKAAWQVLGRQIERSDAINLHLLREKKLDRARSSLRPLFWGQLAQILFGIPFILLASLLWMRVGTLPDGLPFTALLAGIVVQVYGVATIAMAGETMRRIRAIDYSAPVVAIQKQLGTLRRTYVISGMVAGLPWWFLWVLILTVLAALGGGDLLAKAPGVIGIGLGVGAIGLLATWWFHGWLRSAKRPGLARRMDDAIAGSSLRRAQAQVEELKRFEQE